MTSHLHKSLALDDTPIVRATHLLHDLGIPANVKGYHYLREAILYSCIIKPCRSRSDMGRMYLRIAARHNTTSRTVFHAISRAIHLSVQRGNEETMSKIFGAEASLPEWKISNMEYISKVSEYLKLHTPSELWTD